MLQFDASKIMEEALAQTEAYAMQAIVKNYRPTLEAMAVGEVANIDGLEVKRGEKDFTIEYDNDPAAAASIRRLALTTMFKHQRGVGQAILKMLWKAYIEGDIQYQEYAPSEFAAWADHNFSQLQDDGDGKYLAKLVYVVERVLQVVHERTVNHNPLVDPVTGEVITVETLLNGKKVLGKLLKVQVIFADATPEQQNTLMAQVINGTQESVVKEMDKVSGKPSITVCYQIKFRPDGLMDLFFEGMNDDQERLVRASLGEAGKGELV